MPRFSNEKFDRLLDQLQLRLVIQDPCKKYVEETQRLFGELCDFIIKGHCDAKHVVAKIKTIMIQGQDFEIFRVLTVLEILVQKCGAPIHEEIATVNFMEELQFCYGLATHPLCDKILDLLQTWACAFKDIPSYHAVSDMMKKVESHKRPSLEMNKVNAIRLDYLELESTVPDDPVASSNQPMHRESAFRQDKKTIEHSTATAEHKSGCISTARPNQPADDGESSCWENSHIRDNTTVSKKRKLHVGAATSSAASSSQPNDSNKEVEVLTLGDSDESSHSDSGSSSSGSEIVWMTKREYRSLIQQTRKNVDSLEITPQEKDSGSSSSPATNKSRSAPKRRLSDASLQSRKRGRKPSQSSEDEMEDSTEEAWKQTRRNYTKRESQKLVDVICETRNHHRVCEKKMYHEIASRFSGRNGNSLYKHFRYIVVERLSTDFYKVSPKNLKKIKNALKLNPTKTTTHENQQILDKICGMNAHARILDSTFYVELGFADSISRRKTIQQRLLGSVIPLILNGDKSYKVTSEDAAKIKKAYDKFQSEKPKRYSQEDSQKLLDAVVKMNAFDKARSASLYMAKTFKKLFPSRTAIALRFHFCQVIIPKLLGNPKCFKISPADLKKLKESLPSYYHVSEEDLESNESDDDE